jgi:hypothetical protein
MRDAKLGFCIVIASSNSDLCNLETFQFFTFCGPLISACTILKRMTNPINTRTTTPPPTAEPNRAPVVICGASEAMPAKGLREDETLGVTDCEALILREDV